MTTKALRKIGESLIAMADDPHLATPEALHTAAVRINAQAEMIERGLGE